jgi:O-acetyl-ADP-ribose deacetylase (regulator of RNase III)
VDLQADRAVMERVLGEAIVIEPANRPTAAAIVAMIPKSWGTMEPSDDHDDGAPRLLVATVTGGSGNKGL